jgi:NAD(P)-dependent dehydrogenase (short-subunit alcohol dehydrogenase family)
MARCRLKINRFEATEMTIQDKIAIVTGASAGIGRAYALALAAGGATVIAAARRRSWGRLCSTSRRSKRRR